MSAIPMMGNALHSRHIRGAYNRRRESEKNNEHLQRSHSSQARLNDNLHREHENVNTSHHPHHHHHRLEHHHNHESNQRPVFGLSLDTQHQMKNELLALKEPRSLSAPALSATVIPATSAENAATVAQQATLLVRPDLWKLELGTMAFRQFETINISSNGLRQSIMDALKNFGGTSSQ